MKRSFYAFCSSSWKKSIDHSGIKAINLDFMLTRFRVQCFSTPCGSGSGRASRSSKPDPGLSAMDEVEKGAFYVVRKGDIVGVYKTLTDCQAQVGSSVCDPSVNAYKGYSLPKEAEEFFVARGLKNAMYSISAKDVTEDLFGALIPCPFQQPVSPKGKTSKKDSPQKRSHEALELDSNVLSCILEFDGASKGNLGKAGAGAVLRAEDGSVIYRLREGVGGTANNSIAQYRAMLLGLKYALKKGVKRIRVQGDSKIVCMQRHKILPESTYPQRTLPTLCGVQEIVSMTYIFPNGHYQHYMEYKR
ncbi:PREDICTED: uncharacterized protein LOC104609182 isoform X2 [Nelumbo nucifera]|uniref:Uncharacterized protein LOC104609182 isoform X2 n=1 Tax=Nelumbo nucifera TaxID=4432 RepID=A0A1U8BBY8_NELNU|nr:PREDICTED: uncharacterized protein LOC104609182 isoform X2 [Nelumbo nucifera]